MVSSPGRRLFFWILTGLFVITTTTVLFFTFGYRFDTKRGLFIHTGSFTLKVTPLENVTIKVDGAIVPMKTLSILNNAFHIDAQMPGEHLIQVTAPGYFPWEKKAIIESGRSTEFWNITLVGNEYPQIPIAETEGVQKIFPSPKSNLFALLGTRDGGVVVETLDTDTLLTSEIAFIPDASLRKSDDENLEWSPDTKAILIPLMSAHEQEISILIDTKSGSVTNLTERSGISDMRYARWDGRRDAIFYFLSGDILYAWSGETLDAPPAALIQNISGYDISQNFIYFIDARTGIISRLKSGDVALDAEQITDKEIPNPKASFALTVYDEDRIAIRNREDGTLFIFNRGQEDYFHTLGDGIRTVQFSNDGKKLLFASDTEISVSFIRPWNTQPIRAEDEVLQIARFAIPIHFVQWTKDYEHAILAYDTAIKTVELDHRDRRDIHTIQTLSRPPMQLLADFPGDQLFLVEHKDGPTLSTIPFPIVPIKEVVNP
ncbi:MAG: hypothetical protein WAU28_04020 [Candidatus Moraniibacteriota bacterium]